MDSIFLLFALPRIIWDSTIPKCDLKTCTGQSLNRTQTEMAYMICDLKDCIICALNPLPTEAIKYIKY